MNAVVFLGPSLSRQDAEAILTADYRPPVRQGDVYRVVQNGQPDAIAIVDGYFQEVPSVWHKEILWALDQGVAVYGAASMGALRAAEMQRYGMRGLGRIFEAFRDGVFPPYDDEAFEDDDEVAVIHGPAELGYSALSDAMVDLRATFARAAAESVIDEGLRDRLVKAYKGRFYRERSFEALSEVLFSLGAAAEQARALQAWLPTGRVEQKREDAKALLGHLAAGEPGKEAQWPEQSFVFETTTLWAQFVEAGSGDSSDRVSLEERLVLDELRLDPDLYEEVRRVAALRRAAMVGGERRAPSDGERREALDRLRRREGLWSRADLEAWARANDLDRAGFDRLIEEEAKIALEVAAAASEIDAYLLDVLRQDGRYEGLARRAREKEVEEAAMPPESLRPLAAESLLDWYFDQHLGRDLPRDPQAVSDELGFATFDDFLRALAREYRCARREANQGPSRNKG